MPAAAAGERFLFIDVLNQNGGAAIHGTFKWGSFPQGKAYEFRPRFIGQSSQPAQSVFFGEVDASPGGRHVVGEFGQHGGAEFT